MNHSPTHGLHLRRIRIRPINSIAALSCPPDKQNKPQDNNPLILRQTYDITAACTRLHTEDGEEPLALHIRGERAVPLLRCAVIGAAAVGLILSASYLFRWSREWQIRRKYAKRYAERLREQRHRMQMRQKRDLTKPPAADAKP